MIVLTAILALGSPQTQEMRLMRFPDVYGNTVVFNYASDLWLTDLNGANARRLTSHPANEAFPKFSPDGKWIAFTGAYDGNPDVYVIPAEGGEPKRLTFEPDADIVGGWTPDGKIAYISGQSTPGAFTAGLRLVSPEGGMPIETKLYEVGDFDFSPDGKKIVFNRNNSHTFNWRRYRGGTQGRIGFSDPAASFYEEVPASRENSWQPMWVGDSVYYISDKTLGTRNIWRYDTKSKRTEQLTKFSDADIKWPGTDGKTIVFEKNGLLHTYDIASGKIGNLHASIRSDLLQTRPTMRNLGAQIANLGLSPSGVRVAVEARGEVFSVPAKTGDTRLLSWGSASKEYAPTWSPDGKNIAFLSDKSGEARIYVQPQMGGDAREIPTDPSNRLTSFRYSPDGKSLSYTTAKNELFIANPDTGRAEKVFTAKFNSADVYDWSPDNKWIAYVDSGDNLFGALWLYDVVGKKSHKITEGYFRDDTVSFDLNGKYLYFVSARTFTPAQGEFEFNLDFSNAQRVYLMTLSKDTPNPMIQASEEEVEKPAGPPAKPGEGPPAAPASSDIKVDIAGMGGRAIALPFPAGRYAGVIGAENGVFVITAGGPGLSLKKFTVTEKAPQDIISGITALDFNAKRTKIAYGAGPLLGIADVRPGIDPGSGRVDTSQVEAVVNPRDEWKQIFWEAWRWERDRFYDPNMAGVNWKAVGDQYAKYLPYVAHRNDLNYVLGMMIGELGTGHAYVGGGDMGGGGQPLPVGALGADYESANGRVRFKKIYRGLSFEEGRRGPLGDVGVSVGDGDYLLAIDGKELTANMSPHQLLVGKAGRLVTLTVNDKPSMDGARKVRVRTIGDEGELRYIEWVEENRRKVSQMSGGKIGYIHVPNTGMEGAIEFIKGYYSQSDKQAVIIDERFNGGGMIPTFFIEKLSRTYQTAFIARNGADIGFPPQTLEGPKAMLINEYAGSGGDLFPWFFKEAKLGPLIGTRTWGGLVGITGSAPLVDGGFLTAPEFGLYDMKRGEWIAENKGVDPDIAVDARPDLIAAGKDPQLERAVQYLLNELKKPRPERKRPPFPKLDPPKGGG